MNNAANAFAPTVPLLGSQGWINPPASNDDDYSFTALLRHWLRRSHTRSSIAELDDRMLRDIGLTRYDVLVESRKHFWQA
ncbi:MAG TPA: DUF1127 domain-containing protein [Burkholderiaceae bacterium]|nr:DUF1127 domain-containing protein [Burkholderiaceae bacterium]